MLKIAGARLPLQVVLADGTPLAFEYSVPNRNQCKGCHALGKALSPIGPKARFLNNILDYRDGPDNQIAVWTRRNILDGAPRPLRSGIRAGLGVIIPSRWTTGHGPGSISIVPIVTGLRGLRAIQVCF